MFGRKKVRGPGKLTITGSVRSPGCAAVKNAEVYIWHADASGSMRTPDKPLGEYCRAMVKVCMRTPDKPLGEYHRAMVKTNNKGDYSVITTPPGSVGVLGGVGPSGFDLPPFSENHHQPVAA
ncbi:hypothetical protein T484DRAFT_1794941 [Baffinella frigidus]|nr:hypothetical protein T484DRAFT_1794941 [Cryptophyta sp. CCMP2293]